MDEASPDSVARRRRLQDSCTVGTDEGRRARAVPSPGEPGEGGGDASVRCLLRARWLRVRRRVRITATPRQLLVQIIHDVSDRLKSILRLVRYGHVELV